MTAIIDNVFVQLDRDSLPLIKQYNYRYQPYGKKFIRRTVDGKQQAITRDIMQPPSGRQVRFVTRDWKDLRRANLKVV